MRWVVRYLSYAVAIFGTLGVCLLVASLLGDSTLMMVAYVDQFQEIGRGVMFLLFVERGMMAWLVSGAVGCVVFRFIARFGWDNAVSWRVLAIDGLLAFAFALILLFAMVHGWIWGGYALTLYPAVLLTFGFGWHVFTYRWVEYRDQNRLIMEFE
ncbi:MAG: hypothetical protein AAFV19_08850 [Pseudomonadota bacterium]